MSTQACTPPSFPPYRPSGYLSAAMLSSVNVWDDSHWQCETCGISFPPHMAALMIDAVLRVSDPGSDLFNGENFRDAEVAAAGGR